ncbi:hypothetical protein OG216_08795 [Streptomycetaceae bacterium NBC_01309]
MSRAPATTDFETAQLRPVPPVPADFVRPYLIAYEQRRDLLGGPASQRCQVFKPDAAKDAARVWGAAG